MISNKKSVQYLASILLKKGITDIVFSPGSRNAPLINTFTAIDSFRCFNITDERSAAFFALGMAIQQQKPVAIVCTSGSAMLNYAPAIAEAYYQKVPLLVLTADRPVEWVDQNDGQTIRQQNTYNNYIKNSYSLIENPLKPDEYWFIERVVNQATNDLSFPEFGPVHINIPLSEPLYQLEEVALPQVKTISISNETGIPSDEYMKPFLEKWENSNKKLILLGQIQPSEVLNGLLNKLSDDLSVIVLSETISNLKGENFITHIDNVLSAMESEENYAPNLLVTIGGQVVSKKIKSFLRKYKVDTHWHFSKSGEHIDTFQSLTDVITADLVTFLSKISTLSISVTSDYRNRWNSLNLASQKHHEEYLSKCKFSDLKAFEAIINKIPNDSILHLSNSTPIRYAQLFPYKQNIIFQSNRGTSGIDGVISTAAGSAFANYKINTVITGDLAFFYDSNALWNKHLTGNLRIIVINNGGGGIFRFLEGSSAMPALEKHFEARHSYSAAALAKAYNIETMEAADEKSLEEALDWLFTGTFYKPALIEIHTPTELNAEILKSYFKFLKQ